MDIGRAFCFHCHSVMKNGPAFSVSSSTLKSAGLGGYGLHYKLSLSDAHHSSFLTSGDLISTCGSFPAKDDSNLPRGHV